MDPPLWIVGLLQRRPHPQGWPRLAASAHRSWPAGCSGCAAPPPVQRHRQMQGVTGPQAEGWILEQSHCLAKAVAIEGAKVHTALQRCSNLSRAACRQDAPRYESRGFMPTFGVSLRQHQPSDFRRRRIQQGVSPGDGSWLFPYSSTTPCACCRCSSRSATGCSMRTPLPQRNNQLRRSQSSATVQRGRRSSTG